MFRGFLTFVVGMYSGLYICQNYDVPKVDDPACIYKKLQEFADKHKKE